MGATPLPALRSEVKGLKRQYARRVALAQWKGLIDAFVLSRRLALARNQRIERRRRRDAARAKA